jgi:hypothetical protein
MNEEWFAFARPVNSRGLYELFPRAACSKKKHIKLIKTIVAQLLNQLLHILSTFNLVMFF